MIPTGDKEAPDAAPLQGITQVCRESDVADTHRADRHLTVGATRARKGSRSAIPANFAATP